MLGFAVVSSAWFRPAKSKKWGSEIAAAPDRFPPCGAEIWAEVAKQENQRVEVEDQKIGWKDWSACTSFDSRQPWDTCLGWSV